MAPTSRILAALKQRFPRVPLMGFPRLAGLMLPAYASLPSLDAVGLDTTSDPTLTRSLVPGKLALQGNLDPIALLAGGTALAEEARAIAVAFCRRLRPGMWRISSVSFVGSDVRA